MPQISYVREARMNYLLELARTHGERNMSSLDLNNVPCHETMPLYRHHSDYKGVVQARIKHALRASDIIAESLRKEPWPILPYRNGLVEQLNNINNGSTSIRSNPYSIQDSIASVKTAQAYDVIDDMLRQRKNELHANLSQGRRTPLGNIHQLVDNDSSFSSRYPAELNGKGQAELSSMYWQLSSQPGNASSIRQRQGNTRNITSEANDDSYVELPSSPPMHPESESKQGMARIPSFLLDSTKEDILNQSDQLTDHIQPRLSFGKKPKLKCKKKLELDAASTLCSLSLIQPKVTGEECIETNSQGSFDSLGRESQQYVEDYPTRLSMINDESELNSLHCFVRQELLELFIVHEDEDSGPTQSCTGMEMDDDTDGECTSKSDSSTLSRNGPFIPPRKVSMLIDNDKSSSSLHGKRVGFRCVHCAHLHPRPSRISCQDEKYRAVLDPELVLQNPNSPMNVFYPKSLAELYRLVCKWQRVHFKKCRHIPPSVKRMYHHLKATDKTRGKTKYWVNSARQLGLVDDCNPRGGIRYDATKR